VTKYVVDHGGNVGESQAAKLGHYFSLMMLCTVPSQELDSFQKSLTLLQGVNATAFLADTPTTITVKAAIGYSGSVVLEGANQPGIVYQVTSLLASNGLSIDKLSTGQHIAPHGGTTLFHMNCIATAQEPLAKDFDVEKIRSQLDVLAERLNCDIELEDIQDDSIGASFMGG
jgi:glycine cleavage system regulatory protein